MHSSGPGPSGGAAGDSGQDPNEPIPDVSHLVMYISDEDEFTDDPHQIMPTEDVFTLLYIPKQGIEGFNCGYILPAEISGF